MGDLLEILFYLETREQKLNFLTTRLSKMTKGLRNKWNTKFSITKPQIDWLNITFPDMAPIINKRKVRSWIEEHFKNSDICFSFSVISESQGQLLLLCPIYKMTLLITTNFITVSFTGGGFLLYEDNFFIFSKYIAKELSHLLPMKMEREIWNLTSGEYVYHYAPTRIDVKRDLIGVRDIGLLMPVDFSSENFKKNFNLSFLTKGLQIRPILRKNDEGNLIEKSLYFQNSRMKLVFYDKTAQIQSIKNEQVRLETMKKFNGKKVLRAEVREEKENAKKYLEQYIEAQTHEEFAELVFKHFGRHHKLRWRMIKGRGTSNKDRNKWDVFPNWEKIFENAATTDIETRTRNLVYTSIRAEIKNLQERLVEKMAILEDTEISNEVSFKKFSKLRKEAVLKADERRLKYKQSRKILLDIASKNKVVATDFNLHPQHGGEDEV
jgi:hypothetical protein